MITPLASSSAGNAVLAEDGSDRILLDAGLSLPALQRATDYRLSDLSAALITHEHADHAKATPGLLKSGVSVYATRGTIEALGLKHHRLHPIELLRPYVVPGFTFMGFPAIHDAAEPCGFIVVSQNLKVAYVTDTAFSEYRVDGCTHVLIEANHSVEILLRRVRGLDLDAAQYRRIVENHMSLERAVDLLLASDLSRCEEIWLLHLSDSNSDAAAFQSAVEKATGVPTLIAGRGGR